jgi:Matrixin
VRTTIRITRVLFGVAAILGAAATLSAYWYVGPSWPGSAIVMQMQLGSSGGTLIDGSSSWNASAEGALATWNPYLGRTSFRVVRDSTAPLADHNGYNNVAWADNVYGTAFGARTLAVTRYWYTGGSITDADVLFNRAFSWNSYRGPRASSGTIDIRRVALHEFGHVLGLDHPDQHGQNVSAIMNSTIGDLDNLTSDDVAGAQAIYGGSVPPPTTSAPGPPRSLTVSSIGATVFLAWSAPAAGGAPGAYVIEAGSAAGLTNLANFSTGGVATSYSSGGVGNGTYYVRIRAQNAAGISAASNEAILVVGTAACVARPTAPGNLSGSTSGSTVRLDWNSSGGNPTSYIVEAGSAPGLINLANSDTGSTTPSLTATGVGRGSYYVRVKGKNACGVSAASNEIVVTVQ